MNDREEEKYCGDKNACSSPSYDLHAGLDKFIREREDFLFFFFFIRWQNKNRVESLTRILAQLSIGKEMLNPSLEMSSLNSC